MSFALNSKSLSLRTITEKDNYLLYQMYCSTRLEEMKLLTDWTELQKEYFLKMQFKAQQNYYQQNYKGAHWWIAEKNRKPVGRLYLHEKYEGNSIRIIDITVLPAWRSKGIGTNILVQLLDYANKKKQSVTLHVEATNRALKLYEQIGFIKVGINNLHYLMEWKSFFVATK